MFTFGLIGVGGYVAPRHLIAIKETSNTLIASCDLCGNIGILDSFFPFSEFFLDEGEFRFFLEKNKPDYISICTPNHLHFQHIKSALEVGSNVICEKPVLLNPAHFSEIKNLAASKGLAVNTILQLRKLPALIELKQKIDSFPSSHVFEVELRYFSPRGKWYFKTWKGDFSRSGGIIFNIGIHLFDLLLWLFGRVRKINLQRLDNSNASGTFEMDRAKVKWFLSIDQSVFASLESQSQSPSPSYKSIIVDGEESRFDQGFESLHTQCYADIFAGNGVSIEEAIYSVEICHNILKM
jgi:UDP-N-acetyl-2-amino-2-deoxyglucuronate dehydrogenase